MKHGNLVSRFAILPVWHKVIPATVMLSAVCGYFALASTSDRDYVSTAVLRYNGASNAGAVDKAAPAIEVAEQALRWGNVADDPNAKDGISLEGLRNAADELGLSPNPFRTQSAESSNRWVSLRQIAPSEIEVSSTTKDARQSQTETKAVAYLLTSWHPQEAVSSRTVEQDQSTEEADQSREVALLQATLTTLDTRVGTLQDQLAQLGKSKSPSRGDRQRRHGSNERGHGKASLKNISAKQESEANRSQQDLMKEMQRLSHQKTLVAARLAEVQQQPARATARVISARDDSQAHSPRNSSFAVIEDASVAQPVTALRRYLAIDALAGGLGVAVLYVGLALWRFRPVRSALALGEILGADIPLVAVIAEETR